MAGLLQARLLALLFAVNAVALHSALALRCVCDYPLSDLCSDNSCEVNAEFHPVHCDTAVAVYNNNDSIIAVHRNCIDDFLVPECSTGTNPSISEDGTFTTYYACCDDDDYCNKCIIPKELPELAYRMMGSWLDPDCNFTVPQSSSPSLSPTNTLLPSLASVTPVPPSSGSSKLSGPVLYAMAVLSCAVCLCLVVAVVVIIYVWCKRNDRHRTNSLSSLPTFENDLLETTNMTSGSGSGQRLLEQRTIARQIKKIEIVGKGRYGEVWLGEWGGESVAIKIFTSQDEDSWAREGEVYSTYMLHHDNIAKFIACDKRPLNLGFELWMVMEYHHHGSLLDYLLIHTLTTYQAQSFVYSIASGLHYLHVDIQTGAQIKPGIAHRDLKSKNILVKNNHTCCISDFGLAVRHVGATGHVDISSINPRQGTKRYMAPEILDGSINFTKFDSYKMVDMYCFGLIIWEIARRTSNRAEEYQLPYYQYVSHDPSLDDMRKVVCTDNIRPSIASWWSEDELLTLLSSLMQECWRPNPWARLSALRVKKNIIRKGLEKFEVKNGFPNHTFA